MKILLFLGLFFTNLNASTISISAPKPGDLSLYSYRSTESGDEVNQEWEWREESFSKDDDEYKTHLSIFSEGKLVDQFTLFSSSLSIERKMKRADFSKCIGEGGKLETVVVTAGTFKSCRIESSGDHGGVITTWYADVPNYSVKWTETDSDGTMLISVELKKFSKGTR